MGVGVKLTCVCILTSFSSQKSEWRLSLTLLAVCGTLSLPPSRFVQPWCDGMCLLCHICLISWEACSFVEGDRGKWTWGRCGRERRRGRKGNHSQDVLYERIIFQMTKKKRLAWSWASYFIPPNLSLLFQKLRVHTNTYLVGLLAFWSWDRPAEAAAWERVYIGSQFQGTVHPGRGVMASAILQLAILHPQLGGRRDACWHSVPVLLFLQSSTPGTARLW